MVVTSPLPGTTYDPSRENYETPYEDRLEEVEWIKCCLHQQCEDMFLVLKRLEAASDGHPDVRTLQEGLRLWRLGLRQLVKF
jgi:hypothetical protein